MDLIVSVQRSQFLALREMQETREFVEDLVRYFSEPITGDPLPGCIMFNNSGPVEAIYTKERLVEVAREIRSNQ